MRGEIVRTGGSEYGERRVLRGERDPCIPAPSDRFYPLSPSRKSQFFASQQNVSQSNGRLSLGHSIAHLYWAATSGGSSPNAASAADACPARSSADTLARVAAAWPGATDRTASAALTALAHRSAWRSRSRAARREGRRSAAGGGAGAGAAAAAADRLSFAAMRRDGGVALFIFCGETEGQEGRPLALPRSEIDQGEAARTPFFSPRAVSLR